MHGEAGEEPVHLEFVDVLELYAAIIGGTVTQAADQLRDRAGLESALGRPRSYAHYAEADLELQTAVLAHGIAESQTFRSTETPLAGTRTGGRCVRCCNRSHAIPSPCASTRTATSTASPSSPLGPRNAKPR